MRRKKPEEKRGDGYSDICAICEDFGELLCCERCRQSFHLACIGLSSCPDCDSWLCDDCSQNKVRCFDCKEYGRFKENSYRCGVGLCGKIYHDHCIKQWDRPQPMGRSGGIVCPHHYCNVCWNGTSTRPGKANLYKCLKCPTAYHEICIPDGAGLLEDIPDFMLCPKHNDDWKCQTDGTAPTKDLVVGFDRLPLPSDPQDFKLPLSLMKASLDSTSQGVDTIAKSAAMALRSLAAAKSDSIKLKIASEDGALAALIKSLSQCDKLTLQQSAAETLKFLAAAGEDSIKVRIANEEGALKGLVKCLFAHDKSDLQQSAASTLGHLASSGGISIILKIVNEEGALKGLVKALFEHDKVDLQNEVGFALVNLSNGGQAMIVNEPGALAGLVKALSENGKPTLQKYATWALANLAGAHDDLIVKRVMNEDGALAGLVKALSANDKPEVRRYATRALANLAYVEDDSIKQKVVDEKGALAALVKSLAAIDNPRLEEQVAAKGRTNGSLINRRKSEDEGRNGRLPKRQKAATEDGRLGGLLKPK